MKVKSNAGLEGIFSMEGIKLPPTDSSSERILFVSQIILKDYFKLLIKTAFFCGSFGNLDQCGSNLLTPNKACPSSYFSAGSTSPFWLSPVIS
jgi:hypothetical protein